MSTFLKAITDWQATSSTYMYVLPTWIVLFVCVHCAAYLYSGKWIFSYGDQISLNLFMCFFTLDSMNRSGLDRTFLRQTIAWFLTSTTVTRFLSSIRPVSGRHSFASFQSADVTEVHRLSTRSGPRAWKKLDPLQPNREKRRTRCHEALPQFSRTDLSNESSSLRVTRSFGKRVALNRKPLLAFQGTK